MVTKAKLDRASEATTFANAVTANYPDTETWTFNGTTYKRGDLVNLANAYVAATQKTKADHDVWTGSVDAERTALETLDPVLAAFKRWLESQVGVTSTKVGEYGFTPNKAPVKTAASKAASAAKAKATRAAKKAALAAVAAAPPASPVAGTGAAPAAAAPSGGAAGGSKQS
ncbi:MAG TPA: hypothetical protein VGG39_29695 [Polyangiaceae bacterium]|jgi:hypothetical protein